MIASNVAERTRYIGSLSEISGSFWGIILHDGKFTVQDNLDELGDYYLHQSVDRYVYRSIERYLRLAGCNMTIAHAMIPHEILCSPATVYEIHIPDAPGAHFDLIIPVVE